MDKKDIVVEKENVKETLEDLTIREIGELIKKIKEEFDNSTGEQRIEYRDFLKELRAYRGRRKINNHRIKKKIEEYMRSLDKK
ncbi:hypothetical protein [Bacillus cereus group sp. Bce028]|uniref:hypothetical protein n=1 Tax=unclassified Bacillus cereus group TaxID=2750818 RepID=UPI003F2405E4